MTKFAVPLSVSQLMEGFDSPWGICGGWAIDLFLNRVTRSHSDVEIAVLRKDQIALRSYLGQPGWTFEKVSSESGLVPWAEDEFLELPVHEIWCRNPNSNPKVLEVLLNEFDGESFLFRRDASITLGFDSAFIQSDLGLPVLAPHIVLLYKSKGVRKRDTADFRNARPSLDSVSRSWLKAAIAKTSPRHRWLKEP